MLRKVFVKTVLVKLVLVAAVAACVGVAAAGRHMVSQRNKSFSQGSITVKAGDTVVFKNEDDVAHNVYSTSQGNAFNLKSQAPGAAGSATFSTPGAAEVRCAIHPQMRMKVIVQ